MTVRVAVDVGGTFTDVCVLDESSRQVSVAKVPSTADLIDGVEAGIRAAGINLDEAVFFGHGTTIATNALITRQLPRVAMVTTRGFRDIIEIRRGTKDELWDAYKDVAPPYITRRDRLVVSERVDAAGRIVQPLVEAEAREIVRILRRRGITTVAVCFINAYANGTNEQKMRDILEDELPEASISISSEILPEIFEHERFSTTVTNAVLSPLVFQYLGELGRRLEDDGYGGDLLVLHSGGGVMTAKGAAKFPARLAGSGLAAGAVATRHLASLCDFGHAIGFDMGGTSTDITLVLDGQLRVTKDWSVEYGYPICFPSIEVVTIGAGGGSLGWIDDAGSLRNGPQSAGAYPGPACYRRGGASPTNTDANLVLGRLGETLIGGALQLDREAAESALTAVVGAPLELEVADAADAVLRVANANMADALRLISIRRGHDPRDFVLVAFGGAGPLHGADLARELSIPAVLVPPNPGITSALGCLLVDVRHDLSSMFLGRDGVDPQEVEAEFQRLEAEGYERLAAEGIAEMEMDLQRTIDMRYLGQWRSLAIPVSSPLTSLQEAIAAFHDQHEREHGYNRLETPVELYRLNVTAVGLTHKPELARHSRKRYRPSAQSKRLVRFDSVEEWLETPVYRREDLEAGASIEGPAIIEQLDSTVVIPPGSSSEVDDWLNIRIEISLPA